MEKGHRAPQGVVSEPFPTTLSAVWIFFCFVTVRHTYTYTPWELAAEQEERESACESVCLRVERLA